MSPETLCVYVFVICFPQKKLYISYLHDNSKENQGFQWKLVYIFYLFAAFKIIRLTNEEKICNFKNKATINFGRRLCSSFLCFFIFYAKLWFWQALYQWTNIKFWKFLSECIKLMIAKLALLSYTNANFAMKNVLRYTLMICLML